MIVDLQLANFCVHKSGGAVSVMCYLGGWHLRFVYFGSPKPERWTRGVYTLILSAMFVLRAGKGG